MSDKSEKMSDKKVVKVDADLLQKLKIYCAKHDLRMGEMVELLIKHLLEVIYVRSQYIVMKFAFPEKKRRKTKKKVKRNKKSIDISHDCTIPLS